MKLAARHVARDLQRTASEHARSRGIIIADTKFEFGIPESGGEPI
jgi:phosphoribosylaminoimidazole-succinocarboxamide synthase